MANPQNSQSDFQQSDMMAARGQCPRCKGVDTEDVDGNLFCHGCQDVTWTSPVMKEAADMGSADWKLWVKALEKLGWKLNMPANQKHTKALSFLSGEEATAEIVVRPLNDIWWMVVKGETVKQGSTLAGLLTFLDVGKIGSQKRADMIHSDSDLSQKMEPATPSPEAGPSNTELMDNSHSENGASPVLDGNLHSPERQNINAIREALETQKEMEVGKPIQQKEQELKTQKSTDGGKAVEIDAQPGKQIIINIAGKSTEPIGGEDQGKITSGHAGMGGDDLAANSKPHITVAFTFNNKPRNATFTSREAADAFLKGASAKFGSKISFVEKDAAMPAKGSPEWHEVQIAVKTLKMPAPMAGVMGGGSKEDALRVLAKYGLAWDEQAYMATGSGLKQFKRSEEEKIGDARGKDTPAWGDDGEGAPATRGCERCGKGIPIANQFCEHCERLNELDKQAPKSAGEGMAKTETELEKEAGFSFFFPGQVLKEFYPEIQHEIVDYPNASNSPMGLETPEIVGDGGHELEGMLDDALGNTSIVEAIALPGDVSDIEEVHTADASTSPAGAMGIGRDGKTQVLEGAPLRKENDIRGPMFTDEFYQQYNGVPGAALSVAASKTATEGSEIEQFSMFLKKVMGEIAATMIAAFKVTSRPLLDKVPGVGEVQLAQVEQMTNPTFVTSPSNSSSRVKYLMDKLTDSEIQDAINDAWAQAAVWHDGGKGGYVYEVFARAETIDTDSMIMKYKFVAGTKE